jgi:hypothetical protein
MALISSIGEINLDALDKSIADTAVDIFVYDTRKDSDGGKWRKRTKKTSWYNETLNTATRGSRREFPAVAVIVAETGKVTIYDGDDPDLPMWMVFIVSANNMIPNNGSSYVTGNTMMNATLVVSKKPYDLPIINFISDKCFQYADGGGYPMFGNISQRNSGLGQSTSSITSQTIVNRASNDVAMTVLPNAPIDDATGLPIPTIAVATDGGVSIIKDDGTIVDITASNIYKLTTNVLFDGEKLIWGWDGYSNLQRFVHVFNTIPSSDVNFTNGEYKGSADAFYGNYNELSNGDLKIMGDEDSITKITKYDIGLNNNPNLSLQNHGIIRIYPNYSSPSNGIFANISKDYNTGWMHGNIKGAFLSDTDATNVTGSELITNGTFDSNTSGWTAGNGGSLSVSSGKLVITVGDNYSYAVQSVSLDPGIYVFAASMPGGSASGRVRIGKSAFGTQYINGGIKSSGSYHNYTFTVVDQTTTVYFTLICQSTTNGQFTEWDNISLRIAELDRSVNNNGLQVFGTITKSPVATGSDLISYTNNNSTNNYLRLPLSTSILNLEGVFSIMYWFRCDGLSSYNGWGISEDDISSQSAYSKTPLNWYVQTSNGVGYMGYRGSNITSPGDTQFISNVWNFIVITKSGSTISMYLNGVLSASTSGNCFNPSVPYSLRLFNWSYSTAYYGNSDLDLSLFRISASAPSAEQIKKIYEDEKVLFQENAKCTLYGSSDAVTALAYDDKTNLLHVGTSSGRSDFKGLRRINNTTTGITTAISASNRLIAEQ